MKLEGLKILITGASGDVGSALAKSFREAGGRVAGLSWTREPSIDCEKSWKVNLGSSAEIEKLFVSILYEWGTVDVLVNNAGQPLDALFLKTSPEEWEQLWRVHLLASALCARAVLPGMMQKRSGVILNISSMAARHPLAGQTAYAAAKAGLEAITRGLAREVGGKGIRVNALAPGFIEGAWMAKLNPEQVKNLIATVPAGRLGRADEIAALAVFLASPAAAYITGQVLGIDGGAAM